MSQILIFKNAIHPFSDGVLQRISRLGHTDLNMIGVQQANVDGATVLNAATADRPGLNDESMSWPFAFLSS